MNRDILKGKLLEIKGRVEEKWGKITDNNPIEIEGKGQKLLGLLRKKYGYIKDKAEPGYKDSVELAEIVSNIRKTLIEKTDVRAIAFIARYGQPLLAKNQEAKKTKNDEKQGYNTDRYSYSRLSRRTGHLASQ